MVELDFHRRGLAEPSQCNHDATDDFVSPSDCCAVQVGLGNRGRVERRLRICFYHDQKKEKVVNE